MHICSTSTACIFSVVIVDVMAEPNSSTTTPIATSASLPHAPLIAVAIGFVKFIIFVADVMARRAPLGCRLLPLLEAAGGGFLAYPASRGVGLPSRHLGGSVRAAWDRSEGAQPPPSLDSRAQMPSTPPPDRPLCAV